MSDEAAQDFQLEDMPLHIGLKFNDDASRVQFVKYRVFMAGCPGLTELPAESAAIWIRRMAVELLSDSLELPRSGKSKPSLAAIDGGKSAS